MKEKENLRNACLELSFALYLDDSQKITEGCATVIEAMNQLLDMNIISYEALDSELTKTLKRGE